MSVADPQVPPYRSEELVVVPEPVPFVALKRRGRGFERSSSLPEEAVGGRGTAAGKGCEGVWCDDVRGCGVGFEIGSSKCEGETDTRAVAWPSGTWLSWGQAMLSFFRPSMYHHTTTNLV